eukprot:3845832-Amphidinium_carterae.1
MYKDFPKRNLHHTGPTAWNSIASGFKARSCSGSDLDSYQGLSRSSAEAPAQRSSSARRKYCTI